MPKSACESTARLTKPSDQRFGLKPPECIRCLTYGEEARVAFEQATVTCTYYSVAVDQQYGDWRVRARPHHIIAQVSAVCEN